MDGDDEVRRYALLPSTMLRLLSNTVSSRGGVFIGDWECLVREPWATCPPSSNVLESLGLAMPLMGMGRGDDDISAVVTSGLLEWGWDGGASAFLSVVVRGTDNNALLGWCTLRIGVDSPDAKTGDVSA